LSKQSIFENAKHENFTINKGDEICIVRFDCDLKTLSQLFGVIQYFEGTKNRLNSFFSINYFRYEKGNKREIDKFYRENKRSKEFFEVNKKGQYIIDSKRQAFLNAGKNQKIIIWEPIFPSDKKEETDVAYIQYFLLVLKYMEKQGYRYNVRISAGENSEYKYNPIEYGDKGSRLRTFLYLYPTEDLSKIYIYSKYEKVDEEKNKVVEIEWQHIKAENKDDVSLNFGKIFPLITITPDIYKALVQTTCDQNIGKDEWSKRFYELYKIYIRRFLQKKYKDTEIMISHVKINGLNNFENDSLLEGLIFVSTLAYLEEYSLTDIDRRKDLARLHEICVDYAQGIAQLLENIIYHVVRNPRTDTYDGGCGSFTFRIREKKKANYYKAKGDIDKLNFSNFMELYVADFNYGQFNGFVNKFVENIKNRGDRWANILNEEDVELPQLFGENLKNTKMEKYFNEGENIAMHYGLQILNSVVMTGGGSLYVSSGSFNDKKSTPKNFFFNKYKDKSYFQPKFLWRNGTAYIIYLPVKYGGVVKYGDVISVSNLRCNESKKDGKQLTVTPASWETVALTSKSKDDAVKKVNEELSKNIKGKNYYYIDFSCITSQYIYAYEVLSKAIFLLLHEGKLKDIALINIPKEYDVIKVFRQFALFYDRFGENSVMEGKSVYLIDAGGALDLLLYGSKIESIKENLAFNKIYGGYSDEAMEIIKHLCDRAERGKNGRKS